MLLMLFSPRLFMVDIMLNNGKRRGDLMKIKCYRCHSLNEISNKQIFLDTQYICANCKSINLLNKYFLTRFINTTYIIICGILPLSLALYKIRIIYYLKVPLAIGIACFTVLLFFPIYKQIFLRVYNKKAEKYGNKSN